ncbi:hypothetical protein J6590_055722 [Homalodisca vitripennis]|nr:hypothetical protein J6590_055722 [Homalodisca vitripennis]
MRKTHCYTGCLNNTIIFIIPLISMLTTHDVLKMLRVRSTTKFILKATALDFLSPTRLTSMLRGTFPPQSRNGIRPTRDLTRCSLQ